MAAGGEKWTSVAALALSLYGAAFSAERALAAQNPNCKFPEVTVCHAQCRGGPKDERFDHPADVIWKCPNGHSNSQCKSSMTSCVACFLTEATKDRPEDRGGDSDGVVQSLHGAGIVFSTRRLLVPLIIANIDTLRWLGCKLA